MGEWLVRVSGATPDPGIAGRLLSATAQRRRRPGPAGRRGQGAARARRAAQLASMEGQPGVMLSVSKIGYTNTLELVGHIRDYLERKNAAWPAAA
jgi:hypothetical protein